MSKKTIVLLLVVIVAAGVLTTLVLRAPSDSSSGASNTSNDDSVNINSTKEGTFECLKADTENEGPQTLECAFGLRADDGAVYALRSDDSSDLGGIATGARIRVTGAITEEATRYGTAGTIRVSAVEQL